MQIFGLNILYSLQKKEKIMKTLGYIYGVIMRALEGSITAEEAIELIKAALSVV